MAPKRRPAAAVAPRLAVRAKPAAAARPRAPRGGAPAAAPAPRGRRAGSAPRSRPAAAHGAVRRAPEPETFTGIGMEVDSAEYDELVDAVGRAARLELLVPAGSVTVELSANGRRRWPEWVRTAQSRELFYKVDFVEASSPALTEEMEKLAKKGALYVHCCRSATSECKVMGPAGAATLHCGEFRLWPADGEAAEHPRDGPPSKKPKAVSARLEQPPTPDHGGGHRVGEALAADLAATAPSHRDPAMARVAELRNKLAAARQRAGLAPEAPEKAGGRSADHPALHVSTDPGGAGAAGSGGPGREVRRQVEEGERLAEELRAKIRDLKGSTVNDRLIDRVIERAGKQGRKTRDRSRGRRRRRSRSRSRGSSSSGSSFRRARRSSQEPAAETARRQPGALLTGFLKKIQTYLGRMGGTKILMGSSPSWTPTSRRCSCQPRATVGSGTHAS